MTEQTKPVLDPEDKDMMKSMLHAGLKMINAIMALIRCPWQRNLWPYSNIWIACPQ